MRFRKFLGALALAAGPVFAGTPFDGIYKVPGVEEYFSVHESNGYVIAAFFFTAPSATGQQHYYTLNNGQQYFLQRHDNWDLFAGPLAGNIATLSGQTIFGACQLVLQINFSTLRGRFVSVEPTASGAAQNINCLQVMNNVINYRGATDWKIERAF